MDNSFARIDKKFDDLINLIKAGSNSVSSNTMTVLTHLSSAQKVENVSGTNMEIKEQEPNLAVQESPTLDNVIFELKVVNPTYQNTGMMHLHFVQKVDEGLGKEEPRPEAYSPADHALKMINTKAEAIKGTRNKSVKNMKLRKAKEANQDIGAIKMLYLCNHKEFDHETTCYRFST